MFPRKNLMFEALNLPYVNVGKDPYLVTFCTEPSFSQRDCIQAFPMYARNRNQALYL